VVVFNSSIPVSTADMNVASRSIVTNFVHEKKVWLRLPTKSVFRVSKICSASAAGAEALVHLFSAGRAPPRKFNTIWSRIATLLRDPSVCAALSAKDLLYVFQGLASAAAWGSNGRVESSASSNTDDLALRFDQSHPKNHIGSAFARGAVQYIPQASSSSAALQSPYEPVRSSSEHHHGRALAYPSISTEPRCWLTTHEAGAAGGLELTHLARRARDEVNNLTTLRQFANLCRAWKTLAEHGVVSDEYVAALETVVPQIVMQNAPYLSIPDVRDVLELYYRFRVGATARSVERGVTELSPERGSCRGGGSAFPFACRLVRRARRGRADAAPKPPAGAGNADEENARQATAEALGEESGCADDGAAFESSRTGNTNTAVLPDDMLTQMCSRVVQTVRTATGARAEDVGSLARSMAFLGYMPGASELLERVERELAGEKTLNRWRLHVLQLEAHLLLCRAHEAQRAEAFAARFGEENKHGTQVENGTPKEPTRRDEQRRRKWLARFDAVVPRPTVCTEQLQRALDGDDGRRASKPEFAEWTRLLFLLSRCAALPGEEVVLVQQEVGKRKRPPAQPPAVQFSCFRDLVAASMPRVARTPPLSLLCLHHAGLELPERVRLIELTVGKGGMRLKPRDLAELCAAADVVLEEVETAALYSSSLDTDVGSESEFGMLRVRLRGLVDELAGVFATRKDILSAAEHETVERGFLRKWLVERELVKVGKNECVFGNAAVHGCSALPEKRKLQVMPVE